MPNLTTEVKKQMDAFKIEEALWIDGVVRGKHPFITKIAEHMPRGRISRLAGFLVARWSGIKITRSQDTEVGGKGFSGKSYRIKAVTSSIKHKGLLIAQKKFPVNIIIKG